MWKTATQKCCRGLDHPVVIGALYLLLVAAAIYTMDHYAKEDIENMLKRWVPWNLRLNFLVLLIAAAFCLRDIRGAFKKAFSSSRPPPSDPPVSSSRFGTFISRRGLLFIILIVAALVLVSLTAPRVHRIYYDEDIYANVGQMIALTDQAGFSNYGIFEYGNYSAPWSSYNKEPSGWPFLISLVFQLFGVNELYAFFLNNALFIAGILTAFFIVWNLTGAFFGAFLAALVYAFIPDNLIWSNTIAAEPSAALFSGLIVLSTIVFLKTRENRHLFLLIALLPFSFQMRSESLMIALWTIAAILIFSPQTFQELKTWKMGLLAAFFFLPQVLHFYAVSGHSWGAEGAKFAFSFFPANLKTNGLYYLNNQAFPVLFTLLAAMGLFFRQKKSPPLREEDTADASSLPAEGDKWEGVAWPLLMVAWFLLFWGIFLFFYAGSYRYGADVRFAVVSFMPLAILAGTGGEQVKRWIENLGCLKPVPGAIIVIILLFSCIQFLPYIRTIGQEAWGARYDHQYAREFIRKIPEHSIVLTHNPTMFNLWGRNAIQMYAGINHPDVIRHLMTKYQGEVYYHQNYWCNTQSDVNRRLCQDIVDRYGLTEVARAREQDYEYGLYRMSLKK